MLVSFYNLYGVTYCEQLKIRTTYTLKTYAGSITDLSNCTSSAAIQSLTNLTSPS